MVFRGWDEIGEILTLFHPPELRRHTTGSACSGPSGFALAHQLSIETPVMDRLHQGSYLKSMRSTSPCRSMRSRSSPEIFCRQSPIWRDEREQSRSGPAKQPEGHGFKMGTQSVNPKCPHEQPVALGLRSPHREPTPVATPPAYYPPDGSRPHRSRYAASGTRLRWPA